METKQKFERFSDEEMADMLANPDPIINEIEFSDEDYQKIIGNYKGYQTIGLVKCTDQTISAKLIEFDVFGGFSIYTDQKLRIYGSRFENTSVRLEHLLSGIHKSYHNRGTPGHYIFLFEEPIRLKLGFVGKIFKRWDFSIEGVHA